MIAELISVGTELLMGQVLNTDAQFMAQQLAPAGVNVYHQVTVGDNLARLEESIRLAIARADVVILSGGLGPTGDDLTKNAVANVLGLPMERSAEAEQTLRDRFLRMHREMTPNNLRQADFPRGAMLLANPNGTAQGCIVEQNEKIVVLLPGPPRELFPMFREAVLPYLQARTGHQLYSRELRIFGMGESSVEHTLRDLFEQQENPTIAPYAKTGEVTLRLSARCRSEEEGRALVEPLIAEITARLGDIVYATDGEPMERVCASLLEKTGATLAAAESCTGGLLSSTLVDVPGSSAYFMEGAITYSDAAKMKRLGVSGAILRQYGAVSRECAREMANGMCRTAGADYALATTGIAGPGGGRADKPVGLVFIALSDGKECVVKQLQLTGDRTRIRELSVLHALDMLRRKLLDLPQLDD
ncbi:competence/damage-inducible protein A [Christensenellaceae bacterium OttesenSCG-928-L17]|nr:competence/damage-inducible protein A [Christensenellaceae bacterium OttesenSCG-928-L17]